jgi:hypothetical protein
MKLFLVLIFVTHMFACFFYGVAINEVNNNNPESWLLESAYAGGPGFGNQIIDFPLWDKYGVALYWSLTTIVTVGYGDITPKNKEETAVAMFTMRIVYGVLKVIAGMVFAFNVSSIRETMIEMNQTSDKYNQQLLCINRYMNEKSISEVTQVDYFP